MTGGAPLKLRPLSRQQIEDVRMDGVKPDFAFMNAQFLVLIYNSRNGSPLRITVNRIKRKSRNQWADNITWDELQTIKREVGYGSYEAVEIYPRDIDIVNVANMRHLWVLPMPTPFSWKKETSTPTEDTSNNDG